MEASEEVVVKKEEGVGDGLEKSTENKLPLLPTHPEELESSEEKRIRYRSIRIGQVALLIFAIGFSIVLTGVYPYMTQVRHCYPTFPFTYYMFVTLSRLSLKLRE